MTIIFFFLFNFLKKIKTHFNLAGGGPCILNNKVAGECVSKETAGRLCVVSSVLEFCRRVFSW